MCYCEEIPPRKAIAINPKRKMIMFPFVRAIETNQTNRIYTFQTLKDRLFKIQVVFPFENDYDGFNIEIIGNNISPEILKNAIKYVEHNEKMFVQVFYESQEQAFSKNPLKRTEISETELQKL